VNQAMSTLSAQSISRIEAFKIELFSFDALAFDIELTDGSKLTFCEEDQEWNSIRELVETLPLLDSGWWIKVAFPAFEERRRLIYSKNDDDSFGCG
jgi:hypothetical protein